MPTKTGGSCFSARKSEGLEEIGEEENGSEANPWSEFAEEVVVAANAPEAIPAWEPLASGSGTEPSPANGSEEVCWALLLEPGG